MFSVVDFSNFALIHMQYFTWCTKLCGWQWIKMFLFFLIWSFFRTIYWIWYKCYLKRFKESLEYCVHVLRVQMTCSFCLISAIVNEMWKIGRISINSVRFYLCICAVLFHLWINGMWCAGVCIRNDLFEWNWFLNKSKRAINKDTKDSWFPITLELVFYRPRIAWMSLFCIYIYMFNVQNSSKRSNEHSNVLEYTLMIAILGDRVSKCSLLMHRHNAR